MSLNPSLYATLSASSEPTEVTAQYVWGARPGHRDEMVRRDRDTDSDGTLDERLYCLMDYFNPTAIVDDGGAVVERYSWSAFGLRTVMNTDWEDRSASAYAFDFGFHGQFLDDETGCYNYGYRYYSTEVGRWLSRDPIGEIGGSNIYAFPINNTVNNVDQFGLGLPLVLLIVGALVAVGGGTGIILYNGRHGRQQTRAAKGQSKIEVKPCQVTLLTGHGIFEDSTTSGVRGEYDPGEIIVPHVFTFDHADAKNCSAGGFVGCFADTTNSGIDAKNQIRHLPFISGVCFASGGLVDSEYNQYVKKAIIGAEQTANEICKRSECGCCDEVTILHFLWFEKDPELKSKTTVDCGESEK